MNNDYQFTVIVSNCPPVVVICARLLDDDNVRRVDERFVFPERERHTRRQVRIMIIQKFINEIKIIRTINMMTMMAVVSKLLKKESDFLGKK